ncbi:MAG: peptidylprolyl isomerase [Planctomycetota bacterium]
MAIIVNGETVDDSRIRREVERLRPHYEQVFRDKPSEEQEAQLLEWSRDNVIERVLINQEAKKHWGQIPNEEIERMLTELKEQCPDEKEFYRRFEAEDDDEVRRQIEVQIRVERMLQEVCKELPEPADDAVLEYYNENREQFRTVEQIRVAHIVKHIDGKTGEGDAHGVMTKVQDDLRGGAVFEMLVAKYSDCPENGGDLGYIVRGQMVEEFEDLVFNLGVGEISDVFRTRFGFHIAKVYDRRPTVLRGLEEVRDEISNGLKKQMQEKAIDEFVDKLRGSAKVEEM